MDAWSSAKDLVYAHLSLIILGQGTVPIYGLLTRTPLDQISPDQALTILLCSEVAALVLLCRYLDRPSARLPNTTRDSLFRLEFTQRSVLQGVAGAIAALLVQAAFQLPSDVSPSSPSSSTSTLRDLLTHQPSTEPSTPSSSSSSTSSSSSSSSSSPSVSSTLLVATSTILVAPLLEESIYRAYALRYFTSFSSSPLVPLFASSVLFASWHVEAWSSMHDFIALSLLGAVLGTTWLVSKGQTSSSLVAHSLYNAAVLASILLL